MSLFDVALSHSTLPHSNIADSPLGPPSPVSSIATAAGMTQPLAAAPSSRTRALVEAIQRHLPGARVQLTDNKTVLLSQSERDGLRVVRVHQMFLDAPAPVRDAVATFLARGDRGSGRLVDTFIEQRGHLLEGAGRELKNGAHRGAVYDLMPMFSEINARYFDESVLAEIGWGQAKRLRGRRTSITFGSWDQRARRIVIHPVLDQPQVPVLCVARVLHHEMVHAHHGERRSASGRRVVHGRDFKAAEARFHGAPDADRWFEAHLNALLRWKPGTTLRL